MRVTSPYSVENGPPHRAQSADEEDEAVVAALSAEGSSEEGEACSCVGTDYDDDTSFVRDGYVLGGKNLAISRTPPIQQVDIDGWGTLRSIKSRTFPQPRSGWIAVKLLNHPGDKAMRGVPVRVRLTTRRASWPGVSSRRLSPRANHAGPSRAPDVHSILSASRESRTLIVSAPNR